jgi:hypothetical protein
MQKVKQTVDMGGVQLEQSVLDRRGYLVLATFETYAIGDVIDGADFSLNVSRTESVACKFAVVGITDRADFIEQSKLVSHTPWLNPESMPNYYRVIAE